MRALRNQQRVQAPDSDFPFGRLKDTTPTERGTPVNEKVTGDQFQFFEKLMAIAEIEPNEFPDCEYTGFQLFQALLKTSFKYNAGPIIRSIIGNYTTNDVIILFGFEITLSNSDNTATWTEGAIFYNDQVYLVPAGTDTKASGVFLYSIDDEDDYLATITHGDSGDGIADYEADTVKYLKPKVPTNTGLTAFSVTNCSLLVARINTIANGDTVHISLQVNITITAGGSDTAIVLNKIPSMELYPDSFNNYPLSGSFTLRNLSSPAFITEQQITQGLNSTDVSIDNNGRIRLTVDDATVGDGVNVTFLLTATAKRKFN